MITLERVDFYELKNKTSNESNDIDYSKWTRKNK